MSAGADMFAGADMMSVFADMSAGADVSAGADMSAGADAHDTLHSEQQLRQGWQPHVHAALTSPPLGRVWPLMCVEAST